MLPNHQVKKLYEGNAETQKAVFTQALPAGTGIIHPRRVNSSNTRKPHYNLFHSDELLEAFNCNSTTRHSWT